MAISVEAGIRRPVTKVVLEVFKGNVLMNRVEASSPWEANEREKILRGLHPGLAVRRSAQLTD